MNAVPFSPGLGVLLLVSTAAAFDWRTRRIPNWLVVTALAVALPAQAMLHGAVDGLTVWSAGLMAGGLMFMPGYIVRVVGAGDVKLMAAVGAWLGLTGAIETAMIACVVGGVWALVVMLLRRRMKDGLSNTWSMLFSMTLGWRQAVGQAEVLRAVSIGRMPFGIAIAAGAIGTMVLGAH